MKDKLKPCPFCGGEAELVLSLSSSGMVYSIECNKKECPLSRTKWFNKKEKAVEMWNRRVENER